MVDGEKTEAVDARGTAGGSAGLFMGLWCMFVLVVSVLLVALPGLCFIRVNLRP